MYYPIIAIITLLLVAVYLELRSHRAPKKVSQPAYDYIQAAVNQKYIQSRIRAALELVMPEEKAKLPRARFEVGETIRVVCSRDNFQYGWECLCTPFKSGQDEQGIVAGVGVNTSLIDELMEDYRSDSFPRWWNHRHNGNDISLADAASPRLVDGLRTYLKSKGELLYYSYTVKFENENITIQYPVHEKFLDYPAVCNAS